MKFPSQHGRLCSITTAVLLAVSLVMAGCSRGDSPNPTAQPIRPLPEANVALPARLSLVSDDSFNREPVRFRFFEVNGMAASEKGLVIVGYAHRIDGGPGDAIAWFSRDGLAWRRVRNESFKHLNDTKMHDVVSFEDGFVSIGYSNGAYSSDRPVAWWSEDGRRWARYPGKVFDPDSLSDPDSLALLAVGHAGLVAVERSGYIWNSRDGTHWKRFASKAPAYFYLLAASGLGDCAIGYSADLNDEVRNLEFWCSTNGRDWARTNAVTPVSTIAFPPPAGSSITGLTGFGDGFVAVGSDNGRATAWVSPDGGTWEAVAIDAGGSVSHARSVAASSQGLIAVGKIDGRPPAIGKFDGQPAAWSSVDGRTWSRIPVELPDGATELRDVVASKEHGFIVTGQVRFSVEGSDIAVWRGVN